MMKVKKITDKSLLNVAFQENCSRPGESYKYQPGQNCLQDCDAFDQPRYYKSPQT